ncbi:uncharacterized protein LOC122016886 [Zingiber officinale]|uniref:uncharacterized protein LOC122016886 n=1 Tax=Zingiber officinale TaxID=94328 RepID=UPI001C4D95DA|nr:uncharacterized protein LOC122016886 [Zingiber officinale]
MGEKRNRSGLFGCFVVVEDPECEAAAAGEDSNCLRRRSLRKIFSHLRKKASKSSSWRQSISSEKKSEEEDERRTGSLSSSASSLFTSSSSSSCSSSRVSTAALSSLSEPEEPAERRKQATIHLKPTCINDAATGAFFLVASLSATVFLGRLCAILCTSCLLFAVACQSSNGAAAGPWGVEGRKLSAAVLRRRGPVVEASGSRRVVSGCFSARNKL